MHECSRWLKKLDDFLEEHNYVGVKNTNIFIYLTLLRVSLVGLEINYLIHVIEESYFLFQ